VRTAFAMVDRDGDGSISMTELKTVIRAVLGEEPSQDVVQRLFALCDTDGNGSIELGEFLDVMSDWLGGLF
jgi:Ca2+-binding EF-hand superfamily protein